MEEELRAACNPCPGLLIKIVIAHNHHDGHDGHDDRIVCITFVNNYLLICVRKNILEAKIKIILIDLILICLQSHQRQAWKNKARGFVRLRSNLHSRGGLADAPSWPCHLFTFFYARRPKHLAKHWLPAIGQFARLSCFELHLLKSKRGNDEISYYRYYLWQCWDQIWFPQSCPRTPGDPKGPFWTKTGPVHTKNFSI